MNNKWEYYNHALVPTTAPHVEPDISWVKNKNMEKIFRRKISVVCQVDYRL